MKQQKEIIEKNYMTAKKLYEQIKEGVDKTSIQIKTLE